MNESQQSELQTNNFQNFQDKLVQDHKNHSIAKSNNHQTVVGVNVSCGLSGSQLELMLEKNEAKAQELTMTWIDKWKRMDIEQRSEAIMASFKSLGGNQQLSWSSTAVCLQEQTQVNDINDDVVRTKKFSSGFMVESDVPYIVVLNNDTLESDIRVYYIREGETLVSNDDNEANLS